MNVLLFQGYIIMYDIDGLNIRRRLPCNPHINHLKPCSLCLWTKSFQRLLLQLEFRIKIKIHRHNQINWTEIDHYFAQNVPCSVSFLSAYFLVGTSWNLKITD